MAGAMLSRAIARAIRLPLRLVPPRAVIRILSGPLRGKRWVAGAATHGCWLGTYERDTQRAFQRLVRPGDVVYDVGANVGFFTLLASHLAGPEGRVYAFEPVARNLALLRRHIELNEITNVEISPVAVAERAGAARFSVAASPAMGGLATEGGIEVPTVTLDEIAAATRPPSFIKMDIEGGESAALIGARHLLRASRPTILLSTHGYEQNALCVELLKSEGYRIEVLRDGAADGNYVILALNV